MKILIKLLWVAMLTILVSRAAAEVPGILTYQGRLTVSGANYSGPVRLKFALVDGSNGKSYWSNDGSSANGSEPALHTAATAADGQFSIVLGDTALTGMQTIPPAVFNHPDVRLRVWVNTGEPAFTLLAPDQRVTAAGYALQAATLPDGSVTSALLAPGAVTSAHLADNAITPEKIPANSISGQKIAQNSITSEDIADSLRLHDLDIESAEGLDRVQLGVEGNSGVLYMNHGTIGRFLAASGTTDGGFLRLYDALGGLGLGQTTVELGSSTVGGYARIFQGNDSAGVQINGQNGVNPGGAILVYRQAGLGVTILGQGVSGAGAVEVRNASGNSTVEILGNESPGNPAGQVTVRRQDGKAGVIMDGQFGEGGGEVRVANAAGQTTVHLQGTEGAGAGDGAGQISLRQPDGQTGVLLDGQSGALGGQILVNNNAGQTRVNIVGQQDTGGGYISVRDASGTITAQISGAEAGDQGAQIALARSNGTKTVYLDAEFGGGGSIRLAKSDGSVPIKLDASAAGGGRVTTQVLEITGGSDLSEKFHVRSSARAPEPGMIVSIDSARPGELITSSRAYDRAVAGVISGAGGVQPGLLMGQAGTAADGRHPVALTGRVYCWVDADQGAIQPGDLLTTSDTPGHAMKAIDAPRAQGAILGKAMTPLAAGRGLVLVLVSLQ